MGGRTGVGRFRRRLRPEYRLPERDCKRGGARTGDVAVLHGVRRSDLQCEWRHGNSDGSGYPAGAEVRRREGGEANRGSSERER